MEPLVHLVTSVTTLVEYRFDNTELLLQALTHSSYANEMSHGAHKSPPLSNNERLEYLGDAVLGLVMASVLMEKFPTAPEGKLSRWRSSLVSRKMLADIALEIGLGDLLLLGKGEKLTGGSEKRSVLAGAVEAIIGALYLDGGMEVTTKFLVRIYSGHIQSLVTGDDKIVKNMDRKTAVQERAQRLYKTTPEYVVTDSWGPEHEKCFSVDVSLNGRVIGNGNGRSKKEAEQRAAAVAYESAEW